MNSSYVLATRITRVSHITYTEYIKPTRNFMNIVICSGKSISQYYKMKCEILRLPPPTDSFFHCINI